MKHILTLSTLIYVFAFTSCSVNNDEEVQNEIQEAIEAQTEVDATASTHEMAEEPFEFDSCRYSITGFHKDSLIVTIHNWDTNAVYNLDRQGTLYPIVSTTFKALRGDIIGLDANRDGKYDQTGSLEHPWLKVDATFDEQYGPGRAFCRVYVYSFVAHKISSTFTSNIPWGDYYVIRKGVRYSFALISGGGWCNGTTCPFVKGYAEDGDIIGIDVNRDGVPEEEVTIIDPTQV